MISQWYWEMKLGEQLSFWGNIVSVIGLLISLFTLILAYNISKKLLKGEAAKGQLEVVGKIIDTIKNSEIRITSHIIVNPEIRSGAKNNLFDFASINYSGNHRLVMSKRIAFEELSALGEFITNPLTPPRISNAIIKLFSDTVIENEPVKINTAMTAKQCYILGDIPDMRNMVIGTEVTCIPDGVNKWIELCTNIRQSIIQWYSENGIKYFNRNALTMPNLASIEKRKISFRERIANRMIVVAGRQLEKLRLRKLKKRQH